MLNAKVLLGPEHKIRSAVKQCVAEAGGNHIMNLGHGVMQQTAEEAVS
jgi:uroporphyrinogen-III decarboxylase